MNDSNSVASIGCDPFSKRTDKGHPKDQPIIIGSSIVCDGYKSEKTTAVFSHFHEDHTWNFSSALRNAHHILLTEPTYLALKALQKFPDRPTIETIGYNRPFVTNRGEKIELIDANHVPGSSQVLVTMEETGEKILYSGDFSFPEIVVPKADILVLDGTHGTERYDFDTDKQSVLNRIFEVVFDQIENDIPVEILANRGTMQDIMAHLEKNVDGKFISEDIPFLAESNDVDLTNAISYCYDDVSFRELTPSTNSKLNDLYAEKKPYIRFARPGHASAQQERAQIIQADANPNFKSQGALWTDKNGKMYACLAAHATYKNVLKYVKLVEAKKVIVDGTRTSPETADSLAHTISQELEIVSYANNCKS